MAPRPSIMVNNKSVPVGSAMMQNALAAPRQAPPPIGSAATPGPEPEGNLLAPGGNGLAPPPATQQPPMAAMPPAPAPAAPAGLSPPADPAASPISDAARQQLVGMVAAKGMSADDLAAAHKQAVYGVETLLPLVQQKAPLTLADVAKAISGAVKDGHLQPDAAGALIGDLPSDPGKLRAVVQQHLVGNIMAATHLPNMTPATASGTTPPAAA